MMGCVEVPVHMVVRVHVADAEDRFEAVAQVRKAIERLDYDRLSHEVPDESAWNWALQIVE